MDAMLQGLLGQTCEIFKPAKNSDGFGDKRDGWPTTATSSQPCRLQLAGGSEDTDAKDVALGQWKLFLPPEADVDEKCRVRVDGRWYDVVTVYPVRVPTELHHYELSLRSVNGVVPNAQ